MPFEIRLKGRHDAERLGPSLLAHAAIEFGPGGRHQEQTALDLPPDKIAPHSVRVPHGKGVLQVICQCALSG